MMSDVFWMKREWSARTRNHSSSRGFPSWDHLILGAGYLTHKSGGLTDRRKYIGVSHIKNRRWGKRGG